MESYLTTWLLLLLLSQFLQIFFVVDAQQTYINNKQLACYENVSYTNGYLCNGLQSSCTSYITFRSHPPNYDSALSISYLLGAQPSMIADINNITDVDKIPMDTLIIVPVTCSCSGGLYQHSSSYKLKYSTETYFSVANNTYQGLTTCQALMSQNPTDSRNLTVGLNLTVPLRCACPTENQTAAGIKFLLSYVVTFGDSFSSIAETFGVEDEERSIYDANELSFSPDTIIFPFTPLLVPLKTQPSIKIVPITTLNPSPSPPDPSRPSSRGGKNTNWRLGVGIGVGSLFLLVIFAFLIWLFMCRRRGGGGQQRSKPILEVGEKMGDSSGGQYAAINHDDGKKSMSEQLRAGHAMDSLILFSFEKLQSATGFFSEDNRIKGSVYHGVINGDSAAIKRMKGDVTNEINILKQITHSNVIRLSGLCVHEGNTYLVYEFAENGSLSYWLHEKKNKKSNKEENEQTMTSLGWKQRVQIAYNVADGINYLHNYANPPYIHKDLKCSNILLDSKFRAKIANFGVARTLVDEEEDIDHDGRVQLTRHVVGTQGYMAPEYLENGVITPKLDVFAFGVVLLELLSGREAAIASEKDEDTKSARADTLLSSSIKGVLQGENVREKLVSYIDPSLGRHGYPLDSAFSMAQLAMDCVALDPNSRPTTSNAFMSMSKILSSSLDWDPSNELDRSRSFTLDS